METKIKRTIAILLLVFFLVSLTASAVSAVKVTVDPLTLTEEKMMKPQNKISEKEMPCEEKTSKYFNVWVGSGGVAASTVKNPVHK